MTNSQSQTEQKQEHTPTPWKWLPDGGQFIVGPDHQIVAEIPCQGANPVDGEFIVHAVNNYDPLVNAIKNAAEKVFNPGNLGGWVQIQQVAIDGLYAALNDALAKRSEQS